MALLAGITATAPAEAAPSAPAPSPVLAGRKGPNDFGWKRADGTVQCLSDFAGKPVVLEWLDPECPFTRHHYSSGHMQKLQRTYTERGVCWLSVCSIGARKPGYRSLDGWKEQILDWGMASTAVVVDQYGVLGRRYEAHMTPEVRILGATGAEIYRAAVDDSPSTESDPWKAKNYVAMVLNAVLAGKRPNVWNTNPYGCGFRYADPPGSPIGGPVRFGTGWQDGAQGVATVFPAGTKRIYAEVSFENMKQGSAWHCAWFRNDQYIPSESAPPWSYGSAGRLALPLPLASESGIAPGRYQVTVMVGEILLAWGEAVVEGPPVSFRAVVVDASTGRAVEDALVVLLKATHTFADWKREGGPADANPAVLVMGRTGEAGAVDFSEIPSGPSYGMVVVGAGYRLAGADEVVDSMRDPLPVITTRLVR